MAQGLLRPSNALIMPLDHHQTVETSFRNLFMVITGSVGKHLN